MREAYQSAGSRLDGAWEARWHGMLGVSLRSHIDKMCSIWACSDWHCYGASPRRQPGDRRRGPGRRASPLLRRRNVMRERLAGDAEERRRVRAPRSGRGRGRQPFCLDEDQLPRQSGWRDCDAHADGNLDASRACRSLGIADTVGARQALLAGPLRHARECRRPSCIRLPPVLHSYRRVASSASPRFPRQRFGS